MSAGGLGAGGYLAAGVYVALCRCQSDAGSAGKIEFYASIANVSRASGIPTRTVSKYVPLLEKAALIRVISGRHSGPGGSHCANRWVILGILAPGAKATAPDANHMPPKRVSRANKKEVPGHTDREQTSASPTATAGHVGPAGLGEEAKGNNEW